MLESFFFFSLLLFLVPSAPEVGGKDFFGWLRLEFTARGIYGRHCPSRQDWKAAVLFFKNTRMGLDWTGREWERIHGAQLGGIGGLFGFCASWRPRWLQQAKRNMKPDMEGPLTDVYSTSSFGCIRLDAEWW